MSTGMDLSSPVLTIGGHAVSLLALLLAGAGVALALLLLAVILAFRAQAGRRQEREAAERRTAEMEYRLAELSARCRASRRNRRAITSICSG